MKTLQKRLLYEGRSDTFRMKDSKRFQKQLFIGATVGLFGIICYFFFLLYNYIQTRNVILTIYMVLLCVCAFFCSFIFLFVPLSKDAIYEKGITTFYHSLIETLRGYNFHPWQNISKIEVGEHIDKILHKTSEYIILYEKSRPQATTIIEGSDYVNDFMEKLKDALKKNCSYAVWVEGPTIDWFPLRNQWKYFNEGKHYAPVKRG